VSRGGRTEQATSDANRVETKNTVSGSTAANPTYEFGNIDTTGAWTKNGVPTNAARAIASKDINNLFVGIIGYPQGTVTKTAMATVATLSSAIPTLPVTFDSECFNTANCTADATAC